MTRWPALAIITLAFWFHTADGIGKTMPVSILLLDVRSNGIACELWLPREALQAASRIDLDRSPGTLSEKQSARLTTYIREHIRAVDESGTGWRVSVVKMTSAVMQQPDTGPYDQVTVELWMEPPAGSSARRLTLHYDLIIDQVPAHTAVVKIVRDWDNGMTGEILTEVGEISLDPRDNRIAPLLIDAGEGSLWRSFRRMVELGIQHVSGRLDHILFLLVLLLTAPLLVHERRWAGFGGMRYTTVRLLKILMALTIGHALMPAVGAIPWLRIPSQPGEIVIALMILVAAIHAMRPIVEGKEIYVAAGFGLVHGLAVAGAMENYHLDAGRMVVAILGYNIGIELMEIFMVLMAVPLVILLRMTSSDRSIRLVGATTAAIAAVGWIIGRVAGERNIVSALLNHSITQWRWLVLVVPLVALWSSLRKRYHARRDRERPSISTG